MGFLPEGYKLPDSKTGYMKLREGKNKFRVLSSAIVGQEYWVEKDGGRKPVRVQSNKSVPVMYADTLKEFWAFIVWNYNISQVQILEITQSSIKEAILALVEDSDWGDPRSYDIAINRTGSDLDTKYSVTPSPKKKLAEEIINLYNSTDIKLDALWSNDDPFAEMNKDVKEVNVNDVPF